MGLQYGDFFLAALIEIILTESREKRTPPQLLSIFGTNRLLIAIINNILISEVNICTDAEH